MTRMTTVLSWDHTDWERSTVGGDVAGILGHLQRGHRLLQLRLGPSILQMGLCLAPTQP